MPYAPKKRCNHPGCPERIESGGPARCPAHHKAYKREIDSHRGSRVARGYGNGWEYVRVQAFVRDEWKCQQCGWEPELVAAYREAGMGLPATATILEILRIRHQAKQVHLQADHIQTVRDRPDLRLVLSNVKTLCSSCHSAKTMRESVNGARWG
jgi:5-methylcytosine-specific restriction protein A